MSSTLTLALFIFLIVLSFALSFPHGGYHHNHRRYGHGGRRHGGHPHYRGKRQLSFPSLFPNLFGNYNNQVHEIGGGNGNWGLGSHGHGHGQPSLWNQPYNNGFGNNNFFGNHNNNDYYGQNPHSNDYYGQNQGNNDYYGQKGHGQGKWRNPQENNEYPQRNGQGQQQPQQNQGQKLVPPQPIVIVLDSSKFGKPLTGGQTQTPESGHGEVPPNPPVQPEGNTETQPPPSQVNTGLENVPAVVQPLENGDKPVEESHPPPPAPESTNPFTSETTQDNPQPIESKDNTPNTDSKEYEYEDEKNSGQEEQEGGEAMKNSDSESDVVNPEVVAQKSTSIEQVPPAPAPVDQSGGNQPKPWEESDFDDYKKTLDSLEKDKHKEPVVAPINTPEEKHEAPNTQIPAPIEPTTPVVPNVTHDKDHPSESEGEKEIVEYDYDDYKDVTLKLEDVGNKNSTSKNHPKRHMQIDARQNIH